MKFAMLTSFFGAHSFGGDAAFVDRLGRALARRGHEVHVIYCRDAWSISRAGQAPRPYQAPPGVRVHALGSPLGPLSPLLTHQTGRPLLKLGAIRRLLDEIRPDVLHAHNLSLIGPEVLREPVPGAVKLMTAHEHWLVCPLSVLWKPDGTLCERPSCVGCCVRAGRPPQWWRGTDLLPRSLGALDALIVPSAATRNEHARRGLGVPMVRLPYFLPSDYLGGSRVPTPKYDRPYIAAAGRFEDYKGFQDAIDAVRAFPGLDLRLAGTGRYEAELRRRAGEMPNVIFEGPLGGAEVAALFRGARAVVVPSLVPETFGYVVLEAFAEGTPVIARELGALPELVAESQGGLTFDSSEGLSESIDRLTRDRGLRDALGANGRLARRRLWSEEAHLGRYFDLIDRARSRRGLTPSIPAAAAPAEEAVAS